MGTDVRVRFAPSPTGLLHIGGLRTALYNYCFARQHGGTILLRIEDTDRTRYVPEAEADILSALAWAGLSFDEGPGLGGDAGPYYQSERSALYQKYAQALMDAGWAYYAFDTPEELAALRDQGAHGFKYDTTTRLTMTNALTLSADDVQARLERGDSYVIRLKVPEDKAITFNDLVRGDVTFQSSQVDDQILIKSDGLPTYHMANIVDDHYMGITHVIRGEEWLSSTPKHMLLYEGLGWTPPQMAHLPLILSPSGGKLSKRKAEKMGLLVMVNQYREAGYEPAALVNFLAFLGWNPGDERELFTLDELIGAFDLQRIGLSGVQLDLDKLQWFNQQYVRQMSPAALAERVQPMAQKAGLDVAPTRLEKAAELFHDRITFAHELITEARYVFEDPATFDPKAIKKRWKANSADLLARYADMLEAPAFDFTTEALEVKLNELAEQQAVSIGQLFHNVRLALCGVAFGPNLFELMLVLGASTCIRRLRHGIGAAMPATS